MEEVKALKDIFATIFSKGYKIVFITDTEKEYEVDPGVVGGEPYTCEIILVERSPV